MRKSDILQILNEIKSGEVSPEKALEKLKVMPFDDLGYAKIDYHRNVRQGVPEIIFGQRKTPDQILGIVNSMIKNNITDILVTKMSGEAAEFLKENNINLEYFKIAKVGIINRSNREKVGSIAIVSGGTSDMPVCEEAAITAECLGNNVIRVYDVGVAGIHRLLAYMDTLVKARVVIAVAGMEGALASVVGGLVDCPVIAVPTSVGYGANFEGLSALLSMLNSCSSGISVVNIDNGFGAGYLASMINQMEGLKK